MPGITLRNLTKTYRLGRQSVLAVEGVSLEAPDGKIVTLLGPSGCGKSTTMRCIAGLERPDDGEIYFGQRLIYGRAQRVAVPPDRRHVGMVFQSYAIWPHLTVFQNVAYPLEVRGMPAQQISARVGEVLALVGLSGLEDRPAPYLSGGQQQRVALARALVYEPEVLLLDEPLSNLDAKVREQVREEFHALQRRLGITALYVTHDQLEALVLSDVIAVMHQGRIMEIGTPQDLYARPRHPFTASFLGEISYFKGTVTSSDGAMTTVLTPAGPLQCARATPLARGTSVIAGVRPEHVTLGRDRPAPQANAFEGTVLSALYEGTRVKHRVAIGDLAILAYGSESFSAGERLYASFDPARVILLTDLVPN